LTVAFRRALGVVVALVGLGPGSAAAESTTTESTKTESTTGKVIGVSDGDTITYLSHDDLSPARRRPVKLRLYGIDCPELGQPFGKAAKQLTSRLVFGKRIEVRPVIVDRYGRTVAQVLVDGQSLDEALLRAGLAWWYRKYARQSERLAALAAQAVQAKKGLWSDPRPIAPWAWRRRKRTFDPRARRLQGQGIVAIRSASGRGEVRGNARSKVFHTQSCKRFGCKHCTARFDQAAAAIAAGFRPHRSCHRGRLYLKAKAGRQCMLPAAFQRVAREERRRLAMELPVEGIWAAGWWPSAGWPAACTPADPDAFWRRHPWAGQKVWRAVGQPMCEGCYCFAPWFFCLFSEAPAHRLKKAGYAPLVGAK
jgi:endonuclease YncB( thermonuclease family)